MRLAGLRDSRPPFAAFSSSAKMIEPSAKRSSRPAARKISAATFES
jgi:hypothetical protein